jgi:hypothetical protein
MTTSRGTGRADRPVRRAATAAGLVTTVLIGAGCGAPVGGTVVECPAIGYVDRLEVRLADTWPDREELGLTVTCTDADPCGLVRDGDVEVVPEGAETKPETPTDPAPVETRAAGAWSGSALDGRVASIDVRVVDRATGALVRMASVEPEWESTPGDFGPDCPGPVVATVEVEPPA